MSLEHATPRCSLTEALRLLQRRISTASTATSVPSKELYQQIHTLLSRAILEEALRNGVYDLKRLLQLTPDPKVSLWALTGGKRDFRRTIEAKNDTHFIRADGGVVHFAMTLSEDRARNCAILAYNFEVYFPSQKPIAFVRFDLNHIGHGNDEAGLRSHLHPGCDDLQLPSPILTPIEALLLVLYGCRQQRDVPRT